MVAACGGEDSSSSGAGPTPPVATPAPSPSPTPTPTPTPTYQTAFDIARSAEYDLIGAQFIGIYGPDGTVGNRFASALVFPEAMVAVRYDASAPSLEILQKDKTLDFFGADDAQDTGVANLLFRREEGEARRQVFFFPIGGKDGFGGFSNASSYSIGMRYDLDNVVVGGERRDMAETFVSGVETVSGDIRADGNTTYLVRPYLRLSDPTAGNSLVPYIVKKANDDINDSTYSLLRFDWATKTLSGTVTVVGPTSLIDGNIIPPKEMELTISAQVQGNGPYLRGTVASNDGRNGDLVGSLYGPRGREFGLAFELDSSTSQGIGVIYGQPFGSPP